MKHTSVGLFGVTANPPHFGHCNAIEQALLQCDEVYVDLVYSHPFGKHFLSYEHRQKMLELILIEYFNSEALGRIKLIDWDKQYVLQTGNIPYSYDTLKDLQAKEPLKSFKLVIGQDNFEPKVWERFFHSHEILSEFGVVVIPDSGVHSTDLRKMMQEHHLENWTGSKAVLNYMKINHLYEKNDA